MSESFLNYIIILRIHSTDGSYSYKIISDKLTLSVANKKASAYLGSPGDLLIVCDVAHVSDLQNRANDIYVIDESGVSRKAPQLPEKFESHKTWLSAWEGPESKADDMLYEAASVDVDRKLVVLATCACARTALRYIQEGENRPRIAIEMAEAWTRNEATLDDVKKAANNARKYATDDAAAAAADAAAAYAAAYAAANVAAYAYADAYADAYAYDTSVSAANAAYASGDYNTAIRELSAIVREFIPLEVVLISVK